MAVEKYILDEYDGITEVLYVDTETGDVTIKYTADVEPNLEHNRDLRNNSFGFSLKSEVRPLAEIDMVTVMKWMDEGFNVFENPDQKELRKRINENPHLKVAPKRQSSNIIISGGR